MSEDAHDDPPVTLGTCEAWIGAKPMGSITLSDYWDDAARTLPIPRRRVSMTLESITIWRLSLWAERREFDAEGEFDPATGEADMRPLTPVETIRPEWWRRGLFYALRPLWRAYWRVRRAIAPESED